jgi:hypothetical protein
VSLPLQHPREEFSSDLFRTACLEKTSLAYNSNGKDVLYDVMKEVSNGLTFVLRWFIPAVFQILN